MPLSINRVARGLLSYFDSKNSGQPPQQVEDKIRCGVDLSPFFEAQQTVDLFGVVAAANTGVTGVALATNFLGPGGGPFRVPETEIWLVSSATARMPALPATTTYLYSLGFQSAAQDGVGGNLWHSVSDGVSRGSWQAAQQPIVHASRPFVMLPGDQFGIWVAAVTLGTATLSNITARGVRLPV